MRPAMYAGLAFAFTLANMASLSKQFAWHELGSLKIQLPVLAGVWLISWLLFQLKSRDLLHVAIAVYFAANSVVQLYAREGAPSSSAVYQGDNKLLALVGERFSCAPGETFLYWRHRDDQRSAFAVALFDEPEAYNLEVKALGVFTVGRQRGIAFLEPAREGLGRTAEEGDGRFEEVLLGPRMGIRRDDDGPPGPGKA